ncbi:MAG: hypothetical protein ABL901_08115 [Hyphomicrobiaceae bacterium]
MTTQHLTIAKSMRLVHGKLRPFIEVKAELDPAAKAFLLEYFATETLFRRTAYTNGFTDGGLQASPPLARMLANFVKNDACPEITVKTLTSGQKYEGAGLWDIQCFDFIAKRSFDALCELAAGASGFAKPEIYAGFGVPADLAAFTVDTSREMTAAPAPVTVGGVERMADAA